MKIGDRVYVHGYVDEIRTDTIIIRNDGGYFGTVKSEIIEAQKPEDIVNVIRCKDCKYYLEDSYGEDKWVMCRRTNLYTDGEKYCAWAERKEE